MRCAEPGGQGRGPPEAGAERSDGLGRWRAHAKSVGVTNTPATTTSCGRHESRKNLGASSRPVNTVYPWPPSRLRTNGPGALAGLPANRWRGRGLAALVRRGRHPPTATGSWSLRAQDGAGNASAPEPTQFSIDSARRPPPLPRRWTRPGLRPSARWPPKRRNPAGVFREQYADTGGFTDHIFAACSILGYAFVPRIRDLPSKRLYVFERAGVPKHLRPLVGGKVNVDLIDRNWADILRVAATMAAGTMRPSQILRKLAAYPRQERAGGGPCGKSAASNAPCS